MKKIFLALFLLLIFLTFGSQLALAQEKERVNVYFFWGKGCPHCADEKPFLEKLQSKYEQIEIKDYEVWYSQDNRDLLVKVGRGLDVNVSGVPFTVVGEQSFNGWYSEDSTGKAIEDAVQCALNNGCKDVVGEFLTPRKNSNEPCECEKEDKTVIPEIIKIPLLGELKVRNLSLPVLTIVLGGLDGFNPCAMWTLLFLISLLLGMKDKKRRWILGSVFIIASALVYFVFMAAWLNLLLFIGLIVWVRIINDRYQYQIQPIVSLNWRHSYGDNRSFNDF